MPQLLENKAFIDLTVAKPTGLADLGVPLVETSVIKKGRLHEFTQTLGDGKVGRRFQNLRVTAVKTLEGTVEGAKILIEFEVFGDDNVPESTNSGFVASLYADAEKLIEWSAGEMFLPYAHFWYENHFAFAIPLELFERADRVEFIANSDPVRAI